MTIARELGDRIATFDGASLSKVAIDRATIAIMDTVGVALGGAGEPGCEIQRAVSEAYLPSGPCRVIGTALSTSPVEAALLNGVAAHILDYDDGNSLIGGHPSTMLVPPLIALAEERAKTGREIISAFIVGLETMASLARGINLHHYEKGWHPTATIGIFGVAAACSKLLELDGDRTAMALALSVSMASGVKANFGTMTKSFHVGHGARSGLYAALLAEQGFAASDTAFEGRQGFLDVYNGTGHYDTAAMVAPWNGPLLIEGVGLRPKQYPCCGSTHAAAEAAMAIFRDCGPAVEDISEVRIQTHRRRLPHTDRPDPRTPLEAKFSIQYVVARSLLQGGLYLADFEGGALGDPVVTGLMQRTSAEIDPISSDDDADQFLSRVIVRMGNGDIFERRMTRPDPTVERLKEKFLDCASRNIPTDRAKALLAGLLGLHDAPDVQPLTRLMAPHS